MDGEAIEQQKDKTYLEKVSDKAKERSNLIRRCRKRQEALDDGSFLLNGVSVITASYFVYSITSNYAIGFQIILGLTLIALLVAIEFVKRYTINELAEGVRPWAIAIMALMGISFYASFEGGNRFTQEQATPPPIERNTTIDSLSAEIAKIDEDISLWEKQTWKGKIVRDARKGKVELEKLKVSLMAQKLALENRDIEMNDETQDEHKSEVELYGIIFGSTAGLMDIFLIICLTIARKDEQTVRLLLETKQANGKGNGQQRQRRPSPDPANQTVRNPDETTQAQYAQRVSRQLYEAREESVKLRETVDAMEKRMAKMEAERQENRSRERANGEQQGERTARRTNGRANSKTPPEWVPRAKKLRRSGMSFADIAREVERSKSTVHKWLKK